MCRLAFVVVEGRVSRCFWAYGLHDLSWGATNLMASAKHLSLVIISLKCLLGFSFFGLSLSRGGCRGDTVCSLRHFSTSILGPENDFCSFLIRRKFFHEPSINLNTSDCRKFSPSKHIFIRVDNMLSSHVKYHCCYGYI